MRGYIEQRGENSWRVVVDLGRDALGKKDRIRETVRGTKEEAEVRLAALILEVDSGCYVEPSKMTLGEFLSRWLEDHVQHSVRQSTYDMYETLVRLHIAPDIGHVRLDKLSPMDLQSFIARKRTGPRADGKPGKLSSSTVRHIYNILRIALRCAVKWQVLARSPLDAVDAPRVERRPIRYWEPAEVSQFLRAARGERLYAAFHLALTTGMRRGEILGLTWKDVSLEASTVAVRQALVRTSQGNKIQEPKTAGSRRVIALPHETVEALRRHKEAQAEEKDLFEEAYEERGLVFPSYSGTPLDPRNFVRTFERVIAIAGVPKIAFHDLRHTHATLLLQAGVHPKVVAERLGHTEIGTTLDTYSHVLPSIQRDAANAMSAIIGDQNWGPIGAQTNRNEPENVH